MKFLVSLLMLVGVARIPAQEVVTPAFSAWVECIARGPYPGRAEANLSYGYDGEFALTPEDSRYFGDTATGNTLVIPFTAEPGEHLRFTSVNVGAMKVVTWKIIFFDKLYVVTMWDDPLIADCPFTADQPTPTPLPADL